MFEAVDFDAKDFLATSEIMAKAIVNGLKVYEYPFQVNPRWLGMSKMKKLRQSAAHLKFLARLVFRAETLKQSGLIENLQVAQCVE